MTMEHKDIFDYTERFPEAFAAAATFAEFAAALDGDKPGPGKLLQNIAAKYPGTWENNFQTIKAHGFTGRELILPHAKRAADLFADVSLYPYEYGIHRDQVQYVKAGAAFISALRAPGFCYFGRLGASYVRNGKQYLSGGQQVLTGARPTQAVIDAYGNAGPGECDLATFEAIKWEDGRILVTARATNGFGVRWLAILQPGEIALALMSEHERGEIAAENERAKAELATVAVDMREG